MRYTNYVDVRVLPNGNLELTSRGEQLEDLRATVGAWQAGCLPRYQVWSEIMEGYSCNGSFTPFDASDGNPFVGLSSAECIAESIDYSEESGRQYVIGRLWYFDSDARDPLIELVENGWTVFQLLR